MTTLPLENFLDVDRSAGELQSQFYGPMLDVQAETPGGGPEQALTIDSGGSITPAAKASRSIVVDTFGSGATDDLDHIDLTHIPDGAEIRIRSADGARVPTLKHAAGGAGQMLLLSGADMVLTDPSISVVLERRGTDVQEIATFKPKVAFHAQMSGTLLNPSSSSVLVPFDTKVFDIGGYFDTAQNRFVPKIGGVYRISVMLQFDNAAADSVYTAAIRLNGTSTAYEAEVHSAVAGGDVSALSSQVIELNGTTDYVDAVARGDGVTDIFGGLSRNWFSGELVA